MGWFGGGGCGGGGCRVGVLLRILLNRRRSFVCHEGRTKVDGREDSRCDGHVTFGHIRGRGTLGDAEGRGRPSGYWGDWKSASQDGSGSMFSAFFILYEVFFSTCGLQVPQYLRPRPHRLVFFPLISFP